MEISYLVCRVCTCVWILTITRAAATEVTVLFLCDKDVHEICKTASESLIANIHVETVHLNITGLTIPSSGDYITDLRKLNRTVTSNTWFLIGFGIDHVINAVTCVARDRMIPSFVYSTSYYRTYTYSQNVFPIHPDHKGLAEAILTVIDVQMVQKSFVFCQDTLLTDGFLDAFENENGIGRLNRSQIMVVTASMSKIDIQMALWSIHDRGYRLLVVHTTPQLFERILSKAEELAMFGIGYAWLVSEVALSSPVNVEKENTVPDELQHPGLLAVDGYEEDKYGDVMNDVIKTIVKQTEKALKEVSKHGTFPILNTDHLQSDNGLMNTTFGNLLLSLVGRSNILFKQDGHRRNAQFRLLNFVKTSNPNMTQWKPIGLINDNKLDLHTVVWPGPTIFGPSQVVRVSYTIVTQPVEPFVYVRGPVHSRQECKADTECLHIYTNDEFIIKEITEIFQRQQTDINLPYDIYCCEGIVIDLLHALSVELGFDFMLYFKNTTEYGTQKNDTWNGMANDVISGAADMMAGAISITSNRSKLVAFTEAFYFASYGMVSFSNSRYTTLLAFMNPFDIYVWLMIIVSATGVAIATSLFEWNSPFGLNPWGKRRKKNYTLGSALTMVYAMWFGHTVKTKSPKSWPSKFLQNCWSCLSIFVLASYTANLAAFLAGNAGVEKSYSVIDARQLANKRIGVIKSSSVEKYIAEINPSLATRLKKYYVKDEAEAFDKLRRNELDLYADDSPILEYSLSKLDDKCSIKVASHDFGEGSYGIGFSKETWLKEQFDRLILHYVEHGYIEDFKWRYMGKNRHCVGTLMTASKAGLQFGWDHTRGLFVVLLGTIGLSVVLLGLEHLTYFVIVPILKKRAQGSVWKSRNMEYFSQRLYKSINSEKVEPPAKVLLSKVRQTKFDLKAKMKKQMRSVPADMVSYQMKSQDLATIIQLAYKSAREKRDNEGDDVFTVSGNLENDLPDDIIDIIQQISKEQQQQQQQQYRSKSIPNGETIIPRVRKARWSTGEQSNILLNVDIETDLSYHNNRRSKLKRLRSSLYRSRKKKNSNTGRAFYNPTFEGDIEELPIENQQTSETRISGVNSMNEIRNPCELDVSFALEQNRSPLSDRVVFSQTDNCKRDRKRYETWPSPKTRRRSVTRNDTNNKDNNANGTGDSTVRIINEIPTIRCSSCSDSASTNSALNVDMVLKDNRVKSSIRDHAMSTVERRSHSIAFDRGAVEALSKEDLLVLWKRSEIELQTRLNRTLHQNSHLRQLVHIAEVFHGQDGRANIESTNSDVANPENQTEEEDYAVTRL